MKKTTLCYLIKDDSYLMLKRDKKTNDPNHSKYIGVGGKVEPGESVTECLLREVYEETGFKLSSYDYHGIIYFHSDTFESEEMHLFTSSEYLGTLKETIEGSFYYVKQTEVYELNLWEGDPIFLKAIEEKRPFFRLNLYYKKDKLISHQFLEAHE